MAKYGVPEGLINVLKKLYANLTIHLKIDGDKRWHFYHKIKHTPVLGEGPISGRRFSHFEREEPRTRLQGNLRNCSLGFRQVSIKAKTWAS